MNLMSVSNEEALAALVIFVLIFGTYLVLWLMIRGSRQKYYREHEYRVVGEVLESRQIYASSTLCKWELTVQYTDDLGEVRTAAVTTSDPETAQKKSVELAVIPTRDLAKEDARLRMHLLAEKPREELDVQTMRTAINEVFAQEDEQHRHPLRSLLRPSALGIRQVRLWDERGITSEERQRLSTSVKSVLILFGTVIGALLLCILLTYFVFS